MGLLSIKEIETHAFSFDIENTYLVKLLSSGSCPEPVLKKYAENVYRMAGTFPLLLAKLLGITWEKEVKMFLLDNIMEEEGISYSSRNGLKQNNSACHLSWARSFAEINGVDVENISLGFNEKKSRTFDSYIKNNDWLGGISYLMAGMESNTPRTFKKIIPGLLKQGFSENDIVFFKNHVKLDIEHGQKTFKIISKHTTCETQKTHVITSVKKGAKHWRLIHNAE